MTSFTPAPGRAAILLAVCGLLIETREAAAFDVRTTTSVNIVRPDRKGYTAFWDQGTGVALGGEIIPDRSFVGITFWTELAELPGRMKGLRGEPLEVSPWQLTSFFAGLREHIYLSRRLALTADLAAGTTLLDFGDARVVSQIEPNVRPGNRNWRDILTLGAGLEFVGRRFGAFMDVRSDLSWNSTNQYTWNTKRIGLIWRPRRSEEVLP